MIQINKKEDCCGCEACVQRCPTNCISLTQDMEGFLYPSANPDLCIQCGLCEKVCPVINRRDLHLPIASYAAKNTNKQIRENSSSGGIFTQLSEYVIEKGGVVFGAKFDGNWDVVHDYTEDILGITTFQGSKYVQSRIQNSYKQFEIFLKKGRLVIFSGTPCEVSGLKYFLRKDYHNLITIDFICHGVPSPLVFKEYLTELSNKYNSNIQTIQFRSKEYGWKHFCMKIQFSSEEVYTQPLNKDPYLLGFLSDWYLRPSCFACPTRNLSSGADITLGDFWGIDTLLPNFDDDRGVSAIIINSKKGEEIIHNINIEKISVQFKDLADRNTAILNNATFNKAARRKFFTEKDKTFSKRIEWMQKPTLKDRIRFHSNKIFSKLLKK